MGDTETKSFLIINPNSSKSVTDNLKDLLPIPPKTKLEFYTGPSTAPPEIDGPETSRQSTEACFPDLRDNHMKHDGYLVCCYSDHPLIYKLREITKKPVQGIYQASITFASTNFPEKFGILTSTNSWEPILDEAVKTSFGGVDIPLFTGTVAANVNVLKLGDPKYFQKLVERAKICVDSGAKTILLGCAGLSGLENKLEAEFDNVKFIDSVAFGSELLNTLVRFDN
ncbi:Glutamate racemase [Wickerhamomyces ciferrii]|uniref:Glutamate racemase n=1 Tax=Wickerhamomyces ciferrii (strain ATCC 14091 / BCRC 22168 / CBS 111 / JCM 3599 / NBRC 0793 / NRRL Y-1031 F-60-10) TaxID=1206466 RepID=K0KDZ8_WICCF|nr:Glutamate racemase [Wickerhamomyces ciferrii]CCH41151.1 Glutamate racemase [Wickerhamomyces ciferrii]